MGRKKPQRPIMPPSPPQEPTATIPLSHLGNLLVGAKRGLQMCAGADFANISNTIAWCEAGLARAAAAEQPAPAADPAATPPPPQAAAAKG